jgi:hypothetical protein
MFNTEAMTIFHHMESYEPPPLICCDCGKEAEGNVDLMEDGEAKSVCDTCHETFLRSE